MENCFGQSKFLPCQGPEEDAVIAAADVLKLATIGSHDQNNTMIYGLDDRYRGVFGRRDVVFLNEEDLAERQIEHGNIIDVQTVLPSGKTLNLNGFTAIAYNIPRGSAAAYYPEANCLLPLDYHDAQSATPSYKSIPVRIRRSMI